MTRYVALLRGINVSGRNAISMGELRSLATELGYADVSTYIQSGNVVFTSVDRDEVAVARGIEQAIGDRFGLTIAVMLRSHEELDRLVSSNPFLAQGADAAHLHVTFLAERPGDSRIAGIEVPRSEPDRFHVHEREVLLYCPAGYGRTVLNNAFWERLLHVTATTRNWKTVTRLRALASEEPEAPRQ